MASRKPAADGELTLPDKWVIQPEFVHPELKPAIQQLLKERRSRLGWAAAGPITLGAGIFKSGEKNAAVKDATRRVGEIIRDGRIVDPRVIKEDVSGRFHEHYQFAHVTRTGAVVLSNRDRVMGMGRMRTPMRARE